MNFLKVLLLATVIVVAPAAFAGETIYYLFRHAEKTTEQTDPGLTKAGKKRVQNLTPLLWEMGVTAIYSSDYTRTRDTVAPLAVATGIAVEIYDPRDLATFAETLRGMDGVIVIVGHSNTTPELTALLSGLETEPMPETEYDRLYQVFQSDEGFVVNVLNQNQTLENKNNYVLTEELINQIEEKLIMPEGTDPLSSYFRFYWSNAIGDQKIIRGGFFDPEMGKIYGLDQNSPKINIVSNIPRPIILDGGCSVVYFRWDVRTDTLLSISCQGNGLT